MTLEALEISDKTSSTWFSSVMCGRVVQSISGMAFFADSGDSGKTSFRVWAVLCPMTKSDPQAKSLASLNLTSRSSESET